MSRWFNLDPTAGSGRGSRTWTPSRPCARLYYCLTRVSTRWLKLHAPAPHRTTGILPPTGMSASSRVRIGKVWVDRISSADLLRSISLALRSGVSKTIFNANAYAITTAEHDTDFANALNKGDTVFCDGFGVY